MRDKFTAQGADFEITGRRVKIPKVKVPEGWREEFVDPVTRALVRDVDEAVVEVQVMRLQDGEWVAEGDPGPRNRNEYIAWRDQD